MNKTAKRIIVILAIAIVITGFIVLNRVLEKSELVPENEPYLTGNSAGNLYNSGLFCESNGKVYFSNPYDNGNIYVMDLAGNEIEKLAVGESSYINVAGDYLYYYVESTGGQAGLGYIRNGRGIYRCRTTGKDASAIVNTTSDGVLLAGNYIYYMNFAADEKNDGNADVTLHRISTNAENDTLLLKEHIKLGAFYSGQIYYAGVNENHKLYALDPNSDTAEVVLETNMYLPIVQNGSIYYLDLEDDYHLKSCSLSDGSITTLVNERIDTYNMTGSYIYYQNVDPDHYALKRVPLSGDGGSSDNAEIVADGVYSDINVTSQYVYFHNYNADAPVYMTPADGSVNVTAFDNAMNAVTEN